ncbi:DUF2171 domain-containing protein [Sphingomonas sp. 10B4]|nr:DUF2171 domain-containing protein [Sphingomonas sp. 10B4]MDY7523695.1 DUF2171 domain-containing protein [Sphingomonas sp. 10B4]MEB0284548.1 DUF2171 domain-containing protein [Sphingomonas sp. 10B4]
MNSAELVNSKKDVKMFTPQEITHGMTVGDTHGLHLGTVDQVRDYVVELTREGFADGLHHFVPLAAITSIDGNTVLVDPGHATTIEAVEGAVAYARRHASTADRTNGVFGVPEDASGMGGWGAR